MKKNNVTNCYTKNAQNQDPLSIKNEINPITGNKCVCLKFLQATNPNKEKPIKINITHF